MAAIRFNPGVEHRHTGNQSLWAKKPPRLQLAITLAANRHRIDIWELLKKTAQECYLTQAGSLLSEGVQVVGEAGQQRDLGSEGIQPPGNEEAPLCESQDTEEAA